MQTQLAGLAVYALVLTLAVGGAARARAGDATDDAHGFGDWTLSGQIELGGRTVTGDDWHSSKYEEYRELRPGVFGSGDFLLEHQEHPWYLRGRGEDVGERDERYRLEFGRWGHYRLGLDYAELPHVFSNQTNSLVNDAGPNDVLTLSPLHPESLGFRLRQAGADLHVRPRAEFDFDADYRLLERKGTRPWSLGFGNPGDNFVNHAAPIDERIHEVNSSLGWATDTWSLEAGYTGSFFENRYNRVRVANFGAPGVTGAPNGQISLEPDNAAHTFRLTGATDLPLAFPSRLSASLAYGLRKQDEDFLCHTINPAILAANPSDSCPSVTANPVSGTFQLPENSLDGDVRTFLANLLWTARPHRRVNLTARYRLYDYDNESQRITFPDHVESDEFTVTDTRFSVPTEHRRQNASVDVALRAHEAVTLHVKPFWEQWQRSDDRDVTRQDEWGGKLAVDARPRPWSQLRGSYEYAVRRGNQYDPFAHVDDTFALSELSAADLAQIVFAPLRRFDLADRKRFHFELLGQLTPRDDLSFTFTGRYGEKNYDNSDYGLDHVTSWSLGGETAWQPLAWLSIATWYTYEEVSYEQKSRWRPRGFFGPALTPVDSPLNDWESRTEDQVHNFGLRFDVAMIPDRLDLSLGYEIQSSQGKTRTNGVLGEDGGTTGMSGGGDGFNFPGLEDVLQSLNARLDFHAREDLTLRLGYRIERFDLKDFRIDDLDPVEPVSPTDLYLGNRIDDYTAHIVELSAIWKF